MQTRIIKLCYRKIIDVAAQKKWDQQIFNDTYNELLMQIQFYNQEKKYTRFTELIQEVPNASKLHFLVSAAITIYLKQLNGIIPDIQNVSGKTFLPFKNYRFEIIESDIKNKSQHKVAVNFISEPLLWHDTIGNNLLVSKQSIEHDDEEIFTETFQLQPQLSIYSLKKETVYDTSI